VVVAITIEPAVAHSAAVQHTAWMTVNMLCRLEKVVDSVWVDCPADIELAGRINPLAQAAQTLSATLVDGARSIGVVPMHLASTPPAHAILLTIGPGDSVPNGWRVYGEGWWGGIALMGPITSESKSDLPFGPYIAACFAVAEVFKTSRMVPEDYTPAERVFYSTWSHVAGTEPDPSGPTELKHLRVAWTLAGVGAVGATCLHAMWACQGLTGDVALNDGDSEGIDGTNLNRYLLFGHGDVGKQKASTAAGRLHGIELKFDPHDEPFEIASVPKDSILCAVDTNGARSAVQSTYPTRLLMASTKDLRAELVRCDPRSDGPCARCYNADAPKPSDRELRDRVQQMSEPDRQRLAALVGVSDEEAMQWATTGKCGVAGERVRDALLAGDNDALFSVPFVSCAAGTMLAAEACKEAMGAVTPLSPQAPRATLQFWNPAASSNGGGPYRRDPACPMCQPGTIATTVWTQRCASASRRSDRST